MNLLKSRRFGLGIFGVIKNYKFISKKNSVKVNYSTPRRKRKAFSLILRFKDIRTLRLKASDFSSMYV